MTRNARFGIGFTALMLIFIYFLDFGVGLRNAIQLTCDWGGSNECIVPISYVYWWKWDRIYIKSESATLFSIEGCDVLIFTKDGKMVQNYNIRCVDDKHHYSYKFRDRGFEEVLPSQKEFAVFRNVDNDGEHFRISFFQDEIEAVKQRQRVKQ